VGKRQLEEKRKWELINTIAYPLFYTISAKVRREDRQSEGKMMKQSTKSLQAGNVWGKVEKEKTNPKIPKNNGKHNVMGLPRGCTEKKEKPANVVVCWTSTNANDHGDQPHSHKS